MYTTYIENGEEEIKIDVEMSRNDLIQDLGSKLE
jgi:hypothetical protein